MAVTPPIPVFASVISLALFGLSGNRIQLAPSLPFGLVDLLLFFGKPLIRDKFFHKATSFCTACVELRFSDGSIVAIDTIAVENEVADNMYQRSELDWLIYNKPLEYAQLVLEGNLEEYVQSAAEHRLID